MSIGKQAIRLASQINPRLIASLANGPDYRYKYRQPIDIGLTIRSPWIEKQQWAASSLLQNPMGFLLNTLPQDEPPKPTPWSPSLATRDGRPLGTETRVNPKDLSVKVYLAGNDSSSSGEPYLTIFFTPAEVDYQVVSEMKSLGIIGADLQTYHYGGSEETLIFDVSWMGLKGSDQGSALDRARKLANLSKADGWPSRKPPIITLVWGTGGDTPFLGEYFIVEKAPFKPRLFALNRSSKTSEGIKHEPNDFHPQYVLQTVTLKRVK